jgi:N-ethylmaleimide reductase
MDKPPAASAAHPSASRLFEPVRLGPLLLPHRIIMAPMTRKRADAADAPHALHVDYYAQRASAALIVTEATQVSPQGKGYPGTPGIHSAAQVAGWRAVTEAVHARGGRIFVQLWHVGRISHPSLQPGGALPVAPSEIAPPGLAETPDGPRPFVTPRGLATAEIPEIIAQFRRGGENARAAGFDGVEVHAANGYLIDQFLRDGSNRRDDGYGGPVANRVRLLLEVVDALGEVWGPARIGVRVSPINPFGGMHDSDPAQTFGFAAEALSRRQIAYLHVAESRTRRPVFNWRRLRRRFAGPYIANGGFDAYRAQAALRAGRADLISFARWFIANPDLVERVRRGTVLRMPDPATFYAGGARGYTDYPPMTDAERARILPFSWRRAALARLRWW